jgi:hypothetical protein
MSLHASKEHVRIAIPSALKIRVAVYKGSLRVNIIVKDTRARISVDIDTGSAVWVTRHKEFIGEGSDALNNVIRDVTNFLVEAYKEKWATGPVTADMLKVAYQYEYQQSSLGMSKRESLLRAKERILNDFETSIHNKPMRAKTKISAFEKMMADLNEKLAKLDPEEEKFQNRVLVGKARPSVDEDYSRVVRHRINIRFFLRRQRINKAGFCTIECKLGVNGVYANRFSTGLKARPKDWDGKFQAVIGDEASTAKLRSMKDGLEEAYREFRSRGCKPEPEEVIAHYFDHELKYDKKWTVEALTDAKIKDLHKRERTVRTIQKYRHIYAMFREAIPITLVEDVKPSHIREFHEHLRNVKGYTQDYCNKCVCAVYGLFELAVSYAAITHNPGKGLRLDWERKLNLTFMDDAEMQALKTIECASAQNDRMESQAARRRRQLPVYVLYRPSYRRLSKAKKRQCPYLPRPKVYRV